MELLSGPPLDHGGPLKILSRIEGHAPEVVCLTETDVGLLSQRGYTICSQPDAGYGIKMSRRKVILWSRAPWDEVDDVGLDSMPPGSVRGWSHTDYLGQGDCHWSMYSLVSDHGPRQDANLSARCTGKTMKSI